MHRLNRPAPPPCLDAYRRGKNRWDDRIPTRAHKQEIAKTLQAMQGDRCAYCESALDNARPAQTMHIEHFRRRKHHPQLTFDWNNLFGSCNRPKHCGRHKDGIVSDYAPDDLVKPDEEDPERFLTFLPDGSIIPKKGLTAKDARRARETIRVLNLNDRSLRTIRNNEIKKHRCEQTAELLAELSTGANRAEWRRLVTEELAKTSGKPYETALKQTIHRKIQNIA